MGIKEDDTQALFWSHAYGLDGTDLGISAVVGIAVTNERFPRDMNFWDLASSVLQSHTMTLKLTTKNVLTTVPRDKMETLEQHT